MKFYQVFYKKQGSVLVYADSVLSAKYRAGSMFILIGLKVSVSDLRVEELVAQEAA